MINDECELISLITIEYDINLTLFKSAVLKEFDIFLLLNKNFDRVIIYQAELFESIMKYSYLLHHTKDNQKITLKSHPNNYALMIAMISDLSLCDNWEVLLKQTKKYKYGYNDFNFTLRNFEAKRNCCCRHTCKIKNLFLMTNIFTGLSVYTGCKCIKKMILSSEEVGFIKDKMKEIEQTRLLNASYVNALKEDKDRKKRLLDIKTKIQTRNQNRRLWKVIRYIYNTLKDKMYFPKVINQFPNISYYRFIKFVYTKNKTYWIKTLDWYISDDSKISVHIKNKIKKIRNIFLK